MSDDHLRRTSDISEANLNSLIAAENDQGKRTLLLILYSLNTNLQANTRMTEAVSIDLAKHLSDYTARVKKDDALVNKGRGAWKVLAAVLTLMQLVISSSLVNLITRLGTIDSAITALQISDVRLESSIRRKDFPAIPDK